MSKKRVAVFPGTFDPFTIGHESIVRRALSIFDEIIIAIGSNAQKDGFFTLENRIRMISFVFRGENRIRVMSYEGLTVDFCREVNAGFILRGIRTAADFEYERGISQMNKLMAPDIESIMLLTTPEHTPVNSTIVRDIIRHGGDAGRFLPQGVKWKDYMQE
jgi:pantetheine-phosphate adenylyltransferase